MTETRVPLKRGNPQKFLDEDRASAAKAGRKLAEEESRLAGMKKGGKVRATGKRMLHKGEMVGRKACRTKSRGGKR